MLFLDDMSINTGFERFLMTNFIAHALKNLSEQSNDIGERSGHRMTRQNPCNEYLHIYNAKITLDICYTERYFAIKVDIRSYFHISITICWLSDEFMMLLCCIRRFRPSENL